MDKKLRNLVSNIYIFSLGNLTSKLILFLLVPLYTKTLSTSQYGTVDFIETIANLLMPIFSIVIYESILRFTLSNTNKKEDVIKNASIVFFCGSSLILLLTPLFGLYETLKSWRWYLSIYVISTMLCQIVMVYIRAKELSKLFAFLGVMHTLLLAVFNIIFLLYANMGIVGYLFASILSYFIVAILGIILGKIIIDWNKGKYNLPLLFDMTKYSAPLVVNTISWWIVQSSDRIMIDVMLGASSLGLYTIAGKIPALINIITSIFSQAWGVSSIKEYESKDGKTFFSMIFEIYTFIIAITCCFILMFVKQFMRYYVANDFESAWIFVPILLIASCFSALSAYFGAVYSALRKTLNVMVSTLISASVNIVLNIILINQYGVMGAVVATAASYIVLTIYRMVDINKHYKIRIGYKRVFIEYFLLIIQSLFVSSSIYTYRVSMLFFGVIILLNFKLIIRLLSGIKDKMRK